MKQSNKKTILFVHGIMVGGWCWDKYKKFFEERGYRCIAPNLRYHDGGQSVKPDSRLGSLSILDYVDDLEKEIRALNLPRGEKPIIIGHSMGGLLLQKLAERGLAEIAIAIAPAPPRGISPISRFTLKNFFGMRIPFTFWKSPIGITFNGLKFMALEFTPPEEQKTVFEKTGYESGRVMLELSLSFLDPHKTIGVDEKKVACPMLVMSAENDKILVPATVKKIAKKYNAEYKNFPGHAHWIISEPNWEEGAEYAYDWIVKNGDES
ncbi:alpha/beta hydrolase [Patescibacteria group bacterium]